MKPLEQKIIDKYIERFNYLKTLIPEGDCDFEQIKEFILTSLQQQREETIKEIINDLKIKVDT